MPKRELTKAERLGIDLANELLKKAAEASKEIDQPCGFFTEVVITALSANVTHLSGTFTREQIELLLSQSYFMIDEEISLSKKSSQTH